ncbi:hypothetical protein [Novacetimonas hansenii]|nr:hypothetical protein [Novacetimonas hansenii]
MTIGDSLDRAETAAAPHAGVPPAGADRAAGMLLVRQDYPRLPGFPHS